MPFPVSERDVKTAEQALGVPLPAALRRRLMRDNGGEVDVGWDVFELFKVLDRSDRTRLARTAANDIVRENLAVREWPRFPPNALGLGSNGAGDVLVVLRDADPDDDELFIWDHETGNLIAAGPASDLLR